MLPKKAAMYPGGGSLLSLSSMYDLLDEQQYFYTTLIRQQERNYRAFLQMLAHRMDGRVDGLVEELHDLRSSLQGLRSELLEETGICLVPGSGFGQKDGTYHFR